MSKENSLIITLFYKNNVNDEDNKRILSADFVSKNRDKFKLIFKRKEYYITEYIKDIDSNYNKKNILLLKLKQTKDVTDISNMFYKCKSLVSLSSH